MIQRREAWTPRIHLTTRVEPLRSSIVRSRWVRWIAVVTLTIVLGGHWAFLQSVAWVTMVAGYARTEPLKNALVKTFDGQHPCRICKLVTAGKKAEQEREVPNPLFKLDLFLVRQSTALYPPTAPRVDHRPAATPVRQPLEPPTPPPRAV